jgi:type IV pilus assembly protein PilA
MKNKKGFTLVELLAVIVILALIMGIAVVSIGNVLSSSKRDIMLESAAGYIDGVRKLLYIGNATPGTTGTTKYGFDATILESGGTSPYGSQAPFAYGTSTGQTAINGLTNVWKITSSAPASCSAATYSYITVTDGVYSICLKTAVSGDAYVDGTEAQINAKDYSNALHDLP